jgi:hypothetical protein
MKLDRQSGYIESSKARILRGPTNSFNSKRNLNEGVKYCDRDVKVIFLGYMLNLENSVIGHEVFM